MVRRRKPQETKVNHDRWLVSYADFVTLLFAFFVVMYSVSQVSETKYRTLSETLGAAFKTRTAAAVEGGAEERVSGDASLASIESLTGQLQETLGGLIDAKRVALTATEDWVEIAVNANLLFDSGSAVPSEEAKKIFAQVATLLTPFENAIDVSGHTDSVPIETVQFKNNWQLSAARATAVVTLLAEAGIAPERMSATGYGEFRPVADNTTEEGRAANRRVVLHVARHRVERPQVAPSALLEQPAPEPAASGAPAAEAASEMPAGNDVDPAPASRLEPIVREDGSLLFTRDPDAENERADP